MMLPSVHAQDLPAGFKVERYATVWERNPFTLEKGAVSEVRHPAFEKLYLASWLIDGGKVVVSVENAETKEVQTIRGEPNQNDMRLLAIHLSPNPRSVEAVISNGQEEGTVKFRYDDQVSTLAQAPVDVDRRPRNPDLADAQASLNHPANPPDPPTAGLNRPPGARLYPGLPRVHWEGGKPGAAGVTGAPGRQRPRLRNNSSSPATQMAEGSKPN